MVAEKSRSTQGRNHPRPGARPPAGPNPARKGLIATMAAATSSLGPTPLECMALGRRIERAFDEPWPMSAAQLPMRRADTSPVLSKRRPKATSLAADAGEILRQPLANVPYIDPLADDFNASRGPHETARKEACRSKAPDIRINDLYVGPNICRSPQASLEFVRSDKLL
jgi:hypothetical protein